MTCPNCGAEMVYGVYVNSEGEVAVYYYCPICGTTRGK